MVRAAFRRKWWDSTQCVDLNGQPAACAGADAFSVMEANFPLFWGLAIQLYQSTLIADDTPFDNKVLSARQQNGLKVFTGQGRCIACHSGAELTRAAVSAVGDPRHTESDAGFFNTGVRPVSEDRGLSNGRFKTPHLRNVELTGPYFHNGEAATLRQVIDFYDKGGNFRGPFTDPNIRPLGLSEQQKNDLVAFLLSLTDPRVKNESAPFDHPSLRLNNGHHADGSDIVVNLPAVGAGGRSAEGRPGLSTFLSLSPFQP
jgi:cytochrome c peroxidase